MASGFIILKDGRCLARRWTTYDHIIELVVKELSGSHDKDAVEFKDWLQTLIPEDEDGYNGYGGFIRQSTNENIQRRLDLRELTTHNQQQFWDSLQKAMTKLITNKHIEKETDDIISVVKHFLKMKHLADIGDNPDNLSDWQKGYTEPPTGKQIGPGW